MGERTGSGAGVPVLPERFVADARGIPGGARWVRDWPGRLRERLTAWELDLDLLPGRAPWAGHCAVVLPVRRRHHGGQPAVLKLTVPHDEALTEPDALELWDGHGAVRLLAASRGDFALLLERLDGDRSLLDVPLDRTPAPWAEVFRELCIPAGTTAAWAGMPQLAAEAEQWTDTLPERWQHLGEPFPRWLLEAALDVCSGRGMVGRRWDRDVLVHSDLHYANLLPVSPGALGGFVAIDPKPVVGDAEYGLAPLLWNRLDELDAADPAGHLVAHAAALAAAAGLDQELAIGWTVVREVRNALSYLRDGARGDAERSLWVASSVLGRTLDGLPPAGELTGLSDASLHHRLRPRSA
ncbi:hypothetical protein AC792_08815 [Arthrobacter sp. RIT-PI-e]|uniref:aminoglycoside phosphotransferase family protein n=1 Tax=Arthrobacter sp. RIT-PI-e TaxID=1681197 RepID=UPI0006768F0A|nr:aminoglycoside phosphotransferase family protein [Arthrobacter sp. RIT-PI-e]KNC18995.1 hypothetical protein AC792_08815 [Arthrobacter sp. RIT-PI-e]